MYNLINWTFIQNMPELDLQKDINRAIELLKTLQTNPSLPRIALNCLSISFISSKPIASKCAIIECQAELRSQSAFEYEITRIKTTRERADDAKIILYKTGKWFWTKIFDQKKNVKEFKNYSLDV